MAGPDTRFCAALASGQHRHAFWAWSISTWLLMIPGLAIAQTSTFPANRTMSPMPTRDAGELPSLRGPIGVGGTPDIRPHTQTRPESASSTLRFVAQRPAARAKQAPTVVKPAPAQQPGAVKGYAIVPERLPAIADELRAKFPSARIAPDTRTSQIIVIAPTEVQNQVVKFLRTKPSFLANGPRRGLRRVPGIGGKPASVVQYSLRNVTAEQLERSLRNLWGNALAFSEEAGGQAVSVHVSSDAKKTPVLRIHRSSKVVELLGSGEKANSWRQIVMALDRRSDAPGGATQLVQLRHADPSKVREAVTLIQEAALRGGPGESTAAVRLPNQGALRGPANLVSMIFQQTPREEGKAAAGSTEPAKVAADASEETEPSEEEEESGLMGDVRIEYIPELGVLVIKGKRRDVQRVRKIIEEIEKRSEETQPEIELVPLKYANDESLVELITQVYQEVYEARQGPLSITALVKPNAIMLVGRKENIDTAKTLIAKLDRQVAPDAQTKVFHLLHMSATDAEQYIRNLYGTPTGQTTGGATQGQGQAQGQARALSPRVSVIADYRSNSLVVQASPRDLQEVTELLAQLDVEKTPASVQLRVFPLKNTLATDLETVLEDALGLQAQQGPGAQPRPGQTQQNQGQVSKSLEFIGIDKNGNEMIQSGLLTDVSVAADSNSNVLVVKAPGHSMSLIAALIEQLDRIPAGESQIKVFQVRNGDVTSLTAMLQTLFGQQVTVGQVGAFSQTFGRTFGGQNQLQQSTAGESSLIPLSFAMDARTNSIIASGSAADLAVVEAILLRLDEGDLRKRKLIVYRLNNAPAQFVADALRSILQEQQQLLQQTQVGQQFSQISQFEYLDSQVMIVPELISNSLIVSATPKYYEEITDVIEDLDRRPPMIMIQVVVALVRLDDAQEVGVELGIQDSLLFDRGSVVDGLLQPGFNFVNQPLGNATPAARELMAGQAFGAFGVGRSSGAEGFPGLVLSASNESLSVLIRALVKKSRVQILSRPQIMTMNNVPASILVGQRVPQITDFQTTTTGTVNSVELVETGISLGVIPRVTPDGLVIMDIEARDSKVGDPAEGIPIGIQNGVAINSPIFDDITAITTIAARSGQTVVFGGLITTERIDTFRGVPYLSQIPILGHLFRYDTKTDKRSELLFFMTPHIIMGDEDISAQNQVEAERMSWCLADVIELHGDPGFGPGRMDPWCQETPVIFPDQDPTAEQPIFPDAVEPIPAPPNAIPIPSAEGQPGKPYLLPLDQQKPGKPFFPPADERHESRPYFDAPNAPKMKPDSAANDALKSGQEQTRTRATPTLPPQLPGYAMPPAMATGVPMYGPPSRYGAPLPPPPPGSGPVAPVQYQQPVPSRYGPPLPPPPPSTSPVAPVQYQQPVPSGYPAR